MQAAEVVLLFSHFLEPDYTEHHRLVFWIIIIIFFLAQIVQLNASRHTVFIFNLIFILFYFISGTECRNKDFELVYECAYRCR